MPTGPFFDARLRRQPDDPGATPPEPRKDTAMLGNYSKLIGSLVGAAFGYAVAKLGLPAELATPEIQVGVTALCSALFTYLFPANKEG